MKYAGRITLMTALGLQSLQCTFATAQDSLHPPRIQIQTESNAPQYRMRIVPQDTTHKYNMPMYNPEKQNEIQSKDSLEIAYQPRIVFPADPKLRGMEGKVLLKALVEESGKVREAEVLTSSNHLFDTYARDYARQYRFKVRGGKKKIDTQWVSFAIRFKE